MDKLKEFAENFGKFLPLGTVILLTLSLFNLYFYYYQFGVNIADYLSVTEIVLIAIVNIAKVGTLLILPALLYIIQFNPSNPTQSQIKLGTKLYTGLFYVIAVIAISIMAFSEINSNLKLGTTSIFIAIELVLIMPIVQHHRDKLNSKEKILPHLLKLSFFWFVALL